MLGNANFHWGGLYCSVKVLMRFSGPRFAGCLWVMWQFELLCSWMILVRSHILVGVLGGLISPRIAAQKKISALLASCVPVSSSLRAKAGSRLSCSDWNFLFPPLPAFGHLTPIYFFPLFVSVSQSWFIPACLSPPIPFFSISHLSFFYLVLFPPN